MARTTQASGQNPGPSPSQGAGQGSRGMTIHELIRYTSPGALSHPMHLPRLGTQVPISPTRAGVAPCPQLHPAPGLCAQCLFVLIHATDKNVLEKLPQNVAAEAPGKVSASQPARICVGTEHSGSRERVVPGTWGRGSGSPYQKQFQKWTLSP